jgi:negative regulator of flagellin synthesis FlgM
MKITHNKVGQNLNLVDGAKPNKSDRTGKNHRLDQAGDGPELSAKANPLSGSEKASARVDLSARGMEAKRIKDLAMAAPDVDQAKVDKFRRLIDEGNYVVDSEKVADRLVEEHMDSAGGN